MNEEASELYPKSTGFMEVFFDAEEKTVLQSEAMQISPQMTLKDTIALLGTPHHDSGSAHHPLFYSWDLKDGGSLNTIFSGDDFNDFWAKLHNNEFFIPDETIGTEATGHFKFVIGSLGRCLTENEVKVLKDWRLQTKAIYAAIETADRNKTVLFDLTT